MPTYFAGENESDGGLIALVRDMAAALGPDIFERQSLALRDRPDQSASLSAYRGPALVLCGAEDRLCPPSRQREIAALLEDADLEMIDGAGHLPTIERPEVVTAALLRWLARPARIQPINGDTP